MNSTSGDGQNKSTETQWPRVPKIAGEEFQQSYAVAQLAVKLCELKKASSKIPMEKENLDPANFLDDAWKLIESARDRVLREQTDAEYLATGSREAAENVLRRIRSASRVPFKKLCDPKRKGDSEVIHGVIWKVFTTERGFDDLFCAYWCDFGEKWKNGDQEIGTMQEFDTKGKPIRRVNFYSEPDRKRMAARARNTRGWKRRGEMLLKKWKRNGIPPNDFLAIARFRRERDKRATNLPKKQKPKHRLARVNRKAR